MTMVVLTAVCGMLVVSVLTFIVRPLRVSGRGRATAQPPDANVAVYRSQLDELESDRRDGRFTDDEYLVERDDLERRVIEDLAAGSPSEDTGETNGPPGAIELRPRRWDHRGGGTLVSGPGGAANHQSGSYRVSWRVLVLNHTPS